MYEYLCCIKPAYNLNLKPLSHESVENYGPGVFLRIYRSYRIFVSGTIICRDTNSLARQRLAVLAQRKERNRVVRARDPLHQSINIYNVFSSNPYSNWKEMANSPSRNALNLPISASTTHLRDPHLLTSPRTTRTLRKLQSAHALSSHYSSLNSSSLLSQQRQQQQRNPVSSQSPSPQQNPPIPPSSSHHRTRSNSDALLSSFLNSTSAPTRRSAVAKKVASAQTPKDELEALVRQGPRGDVPAGLQRLRHLILCDGLDADSDGMVSDLSLSNPTKSHTSC